ncbi:hypothetical protein PIIN_06424 [Serendipita indica DSM 11827]|uniref:Uncharacterized protein n=1 Tax=Serendipita indica (strain DSM 11827) TaxID=1109443 RepID=G4TMF4_SERID|nr:hypothetical protein PIIN_06424 [Serendipita indica DSM 11827]
MTSAFFQPPKGSSGSRTIYSVLSRNSRSNNDYKRRLTAVDEGLRSPALSESSLSSGSGSSYASSTFGTSSPIRYGSPSCTEEAVTPTTVEEEPAFDATDAKQLDWFVPEYLIKAIDAARYSSWGDFGDEICWDALPLDFGFSAVPSTRPDQTFPHELSREQVILLHMFVHQYRNYAAGYEEICHFANKVNLPVTLVVHYLCFYQ